MKYYYIIFETGNKGYVIDSTQSEIHPKEFENRYFKLETSIKNQMNNGFTDLEIIKNISTIKSYSIETYKSEIVVNDEVIDFVKWGLGESNFLYFIIASQKITDFFNLPRLHSSLFCYFSGLVKEDGKEKLLYLYMN